ncbi:MAG: hypothetical protein BWY74_04179 [Firmicutes bacterium ADurb.Bin419]|nr:MAG: hypothetical protein BWY74_04179 [Firmicutes bacterium ADurb.Bin419]
MKASAIFFKTIKFVWVKLFLGLLTVVASVMLLAILLGLGMLFGEGIVALMFLIWLVRKV